MVVRLQLWFVSGEFLWILPWWITNQRSRAARNRNRYGNIHSCGETVGSCQVATDTQAATICAHESHEEWPQSSPKHGHAKHIGQDVLAKSSECWFAYGRIKLRGEYMQAWEDKLVYMTEYLVWTKRTSIRRAPSWTTVEVHGWAGDTSTIAYGDTGRWNICLSCFPNTVSRQIQENRNPINFVQVSMIG